MDQVVVGVVQWLNGGSGGGGTLSGSDDGVADSFCSSIVVDVGRGLDTTDDSPSEDGRLAGVGVGRVGGIGGGREGGIGSDSSSEVGGIGIGSSSSEYGIGSGSSPSGSGGIGTGLSPSGRGSLLSDIGTYAAAST